MPTSENTNASNEYFKNRNGFTFPDEYRAKQPISQKYKLDVRPNKVIKIKKWIGSNWFNICSLVVNIVLAYFTYALFLQTKTSTQAAVDAAKEAKRSTDHSIQIDSVNYVRDTASDRKQDEKDRLTIQLANKSLDAQIGSIKETQRQFELSTKPFLQFIDFKVYYNDSDFRINVEPTIVNQGIQPAKILFYYNTLFFGPDTTVSYIRNNYQGEQKKVIIDWYIIKENPRNYRLGWSNRLAPSLYKNIKDGKVFVYLFGEMIFENAITKERRKYIYTIRLQIIYPIGSSYTVLENENIDYK